MDRAALATFIATDLDALLAEAGIATTDTPDGLAPILDTVEMVAPSDLPASWYGPLGRYVALDRIVKRFAVNMPVSISGDSYGLQKQFEHAKALRDEARAQVAWIIDPVQPGGDAAGTGITIEMPYLAGGSDSW